MIEAAGAIPGIKVDKGTTPLPFCPGELITEGLDGLGQRLAEYRGLGARFAKWRAVIDIGAGIPTSTAIRTNTHALARYAALCQAAQVVPIVEPEVLMDGEPGTHVLPTQPAARMAELMLDTVLPDLPFASGDRVAVLVSGLGATPVMEQYVLYGRVAAVLTYAGCRPARPGATGRTRSRLRGSRGEGCDARTRRPALRSAVRAGS